MPKSTEDGKIFEETNPDGTNLFAQIQNVVGTAILGARLHLTPAARRMSEDALITYIPEQFPGLVVKMIEPKVSALIFASGKMVITGAKSEQMIHQAVKIVISLLNEAGHDVKGRAQITVQNVVASGTIGRKINLELAALLLDNSMYEPEQFPGLIYRMEDPKLVLLLFQSGNLVCTGARKQEHVIESIRKVYQTLQEIDALDEAEEL